MLMMMMMEIGEESMKFSRHFGKLTLSGDLLSFVGKFQAV